MLFWIIILLAIAGVATAIGAIFTSYDYPNISKTLQYISLSLTALFFALMIVDIVQSGKERELEEARAEEAKALAIQECKRLPDMEDRITCRILLEK